MGRHLIVREIAKGTIGPLYLARTQNSDDTVDTLARVIPLPADLPPRDDQLIAEAIWDSANVGHDMVLRVADVVAGKGWVTLVHDFQLGTLIGTMHRRARDLGSAFPAEVAARIALDVLEGLEQSRGLCEANQIPWRPGSVSISSLYLCGDGRTRALDGQVMAAVLRSAQMRMVSGTANSVAPEVLNETTEPDERTDVFAVGIVLWELLTGREILVDRAAPVSNVIQSVPRGVDVPQGLVNALHRALEIEPDRRQSTLRELAVALVMGAEKVATYEQVIEFASTLLPYERAFQVMAPVAAQPPQAEPRAMDVSSNPVTKIEPSPTALQTDSRASSNPPAPRFASPLAPAPAAPSPTNNPAGATSEASRMEPSADSPMSMAAGTDGPSARLDETRIATAATAQELDISINAKGGRLEQISWPDDEASPLLGAKVASAPVEANKKSNGAKPVSAISEQLQALEPTDTTVQQPTANQDPPKNQPSPAKTAERGQATGVSPAPQDRSEQRASSPAEPSLKIARKDSARPLSSSKAPKSSTGLQASAKSASPRPKSTKSVEPPAPPTAETSSEASGAKKTGLQISMTTLILALSTTVLAVILIMVLVQRNAQPSPGQSSNANVPAAKSDLPSSERTTPIASSIPKEPTTDRIEDERASPVTSKGPEAKTSTAADTRIDRQKRPTKAGGSGMAKPATPEDDSPNDDVKAPKKPKNYVPSDL